MSSVQRRGSPQARKPRQDLGTVRTDGAVVAPNRVFLLPLALTSALFLVSLTPRVQSNQNLTLAFWSAVVGLLVWQAFLFLRVKQTGEPRSLLLTAPRKQHYIQAMCQGSIFLYWGWYWNPVYNYAWLLLAQLLFAFAFDMLLSWTRRDHFALSFGPLPIIFSINLFLWFRDDWFIFQFVLVGVGFLGKELIRWHREGKKVHIFNPSAFSLGLFSVVLIATGTTHLTWGPEIASTLSLAPHIYLFLFGIGLVVMYFFAITLVAASAAATLFGLSALYSAITGVPYFLDSEIPTAVFLGLHLLITDPSTSPRTPPGKLVFGVVYGLSVFGLYSLLGAFGAPTFYDKLMAVPLLNLSVRWIDHYVQKFREQGTLSRVYANWGTPRVNLAFMGAWILFFGAMTATSRTDGMHTGDSVPFWVQACEEGRPTACERLVLLESTYCVDNSGWACNALGLLYQEGRHVSANPELARGYFARACELRFQPGCLNLLDPGSAPDPAPRAMDLRLLLREGGLNLMEMPERELYARACVHDWAFACERIAGAQ
jgi:hypothetical protein